MKVEISAISGVRTFYSSFEDDERGSVSKIINIDQIETGKNFFAQLLYAKNSKMGTIRGMHFQVGENAESKYIWCSEGSFFDVLIDVRPGSSTFGSWSSIVLSSKNRRVLYLPPGIAHGYQTLEDDSSACYLIDKPYDPLNSIVLFFDDPSIEISWPLPVVSVSDKDKKGLKWPLKFL